MSDLNINKNLGLVEIINLVLSQEEVEVVLNVDPESILISDKVNLSILLKIAEDSGKEVKINTTSERGQKLIADVFYNEEEDRDLDIDRIIEDDESFSHLNSKTSVSQKDSSNKKISDLGTNISLPKLSVSLPKFDFSFLKGNKFFPILIVLWLSLFTGGYFYLNSTLTTNIEIFVAAERFVKSLEVRLSTIKSTDVDGKVFKGEKYVQTLILIKEVETTGKIDSGKKATGEVTITNKSDNPLNLKKGSKIEHKTGSKEVVYLTLEDLELPARKLESSSPDVYVNTSKEVQVEALEFGSSSNLEVNKAVSVDGKSSELISGIVSKAISGGVKEDIKAVSSEDLKKVYDLGIAEIKESFKPAEVSGKVFLKGSEQFTVTKTEYSGKAGDAMDTLKLTLTVDVVGLLYDVKDAENFVKASMKSILPEGFEVYGKELEIEMNLLGNTNSSTLTVDEGDVQLTIKTYKIPVLNPSEIKSMLLGKTSEEAVNIVNKIPNVVKYNISFNYPVFNSIPTDPERINVSISKE